ncbi:uncharacterized protein LOC131048650 isoform X3 [Cryptomeria japonica]|uniref:uncharacterized protein LOC131048650 isoform X3 n=1 Tax=Cryptomeria japonica TaxID=3369 RepID=UPI0025AC092C|nr:uncharacterized protein LOC131048650 isoform X3 [Cryptomeria japonica]
MESFRRYGLPFSLAGAIQSPISSLLDFSRRSETGSNSANGGLLFRGFSRGDDVAGRAADEVGAAEVSIRIFSSGEAEEHGSGNDYDSRGEQGFEPATSSLQTNGIETALTSMPSLSTAADVAARRDRSDGDINGANNTSSNNNNNTGSQRYEIQQLARWIEQVLPFSLLLFIIFVRQHLQGFLISFWITAVLIKLNDLLRKQTALKGERKILVLIGIMSVLVLHVAGLYWWYKNDDLWYPLLMLPPKIIPPFWHAIFVIIVNDTMVRQAAMILKCGLLIYYKSNRGCNYRKQVQASFAALKALSHKEVQYGSYATAEEVVAAGDLCAICQEKMHAPILLRCKHMFCDDCVSEWFERERTCPLCRAIVKPAELRSFGDGSTSLLFQLF